MVETNNSHTLKLIGTCELPQSLDYGFDYVIALKGSLEEIAKRDNHDGTYEFVNKIKLQRVELADKQGKTFKGTAKGSKSQKLRFRILEHTDNDGYEVIMSKIIDNLDEILEIIK